MSSPSIFQCFDKYVVSCAFVYPNPMRRPLQHHINATSVPLPQSGAAPSHMGQLSPPPNPDPDLSAGPKIYLVYYTDGINRTSSCERSGSLSQGASLSVFSLSQFFLSLTPHTEELPRNKKEASCQLISTSQYSHHATVQRSSTKHAIIITATTSNYYCLDTFCCPWYYWGNRNSFASSYHCCWMACLFGSLDLLHPHSERRRSPLAKLHIGFRVSFVFCCLI
jgi:hypothetical protein